MLTYRLKNSLRSSENVDWKQLVIDSLGEGVHPNRAQGFCLARAALQECLEELNIHLGVKDLVLQGYGEVLGVAGVQLSLSHSTDWGAAVVTNDPSIVSVGIDIEPLGRVVKPMILERVSHPEDAKLSALSIWALKEAVFKCLMNTKKFEKPIEFSSIQISESHWDQSDSKLTGLWKLTEQQGQLVALAWIKT